MRVTSMVAGLAFVLAAWAAARRRLKISRRRRPPSSRPAARPRLPALLPAPGASHDVSMVLEGSTYKFDPSELTIKAGDVVTFHNKSGGPHNVSFWADSIPKRRRGCAQERDARPDGPARGPAAHRADGIYKVSFAGAPTGEYKFYCLPHLALGMHGKITVQ